jgi:hypothetical protein
MTYELVIIKTPNGKFIFRGCVPCALDGLGLRYTRSGPSRTSLPPLQPIHVGISKRGGYFVYKIGNHRTPKFV